MSANNTCRLRAVNVLKVIDNYFQGNYSLVDKITDEIIGVNNDGVIKRIFSNDKTSDSFIYKSNRDHNAISINTITDICRWCRRSFEGDPVGIPINYSKQEGKIKFSIEHPCCDFACALAMLNTLKDTKYSISKMLLNLWFKMLYPDEILRPANSWLLLNINGGPLTEDEFFDQNFNYIYHETIEIIDTKSIYLKRKCLK